MTHEAQHAQRPPRQRLRSNGITGKVPQPTDQELIHFAEVWYVSASGLFLGCVSCHSGAEVFFLLNFFRGEGGCEVFELRNLADLYVAFAFVVGASFGPLDRLFQRLDLPEPDAGNEFLAFGAVSDGALLAREVDAGAFRRGVKTIVAYQNSGFQELVVEFDQVGHELGIGHSAHAVDRARNRFSESHFGGEAGLWLATYMRDLVNTQIRLLLHFM
jgi:hypothetical protein